MEKLLHGTTITLRALRLVLLRLLQSGLRDRVALMLWGPPGTGKTSILRQVAGEANEGFVLENLVTTDYLHVCGTPEKRKGMKRRVRIPMIDVPAEGRGVYVLDDLTHQAQHLQNVVLNLALERRLNDAHLGSGWLLCFTGNDVGGVHTMHPPVANRILHFYVLADLESYKAWALGAGVRQDVLSFLELYPSMLSVVPEQQEKAFPTPRSWAQLSALLDVFEGKDEARCVCEAAVGAVAAGQFLLHQRTHGLIPFAGILDGTVDGLEPLATRVEGVKDPALALTVLRYSLCAHARAWWAEHKGRRVREGEGVEMERVLGCLPAAYQTMLVRDMQQMAPTRLMKVLEGDGSAGLRELMGRLGAVQADVDLPDVD